MERGMIDRAKIRRIIQEEAIELDLNLPEPIRRSNPVVKRHLSFYWKTTSMDVEFIFKVFVFQAVFVGITFVFPALFQIIMPTATVSIIMIPLSMAIYAWVLYKIGRQSAFHVSDEYTNNTFDLLRITPRSLQSILYSKAAASIWRYVEDLGLLLISTALFSLPILIVQFELLISYEDYPVLMRASLLGALATSILRIPLEVIMASAIGSAVGTLANRRTTAAVSTTLSLIAYFYFVNVIRLLPLGIVPQLFVDIVLPLLLPSLIIWGCFQFATFQISRR